MTVTVRTEADATDRAEDSLDRAVAHLLALQDRAGWWKGELETNVTMDAEDLLFREFLGIRTAEQTEQSARWIRANQRDDGTWATFRGGPAELSTTVEAYVALKLAGDAADADHMKRAAAYIRDNGGVAHSRVFTRFWLAFFGWWSWDDLPVLPPELIYLPKWMPLNVYDFACWARQTIVPLTIVSSLRPVHPAPFDLDELRPTGPVPPKVVADDAWSRFFRAADKALHLYGKRPVKAVRRRAVKRAVQWIIERQEADGGWGGIQPPWVYSLIALHLSGYPLNHPVMAQGIKGLDGFTIWEDTPDGTVRRFEACQSPVWDTGLSLVALRDAGVAADHPQVVRAAEWLFDEEIREVGDWAVRRPGLEPGGWAFEFANDYYPDTDDTAEVVMALRYAATPNTARKKEILARAEAWTAGMRSKDGGWGAFDADNTGQLPLKLPFCDFGAVIDPPSADVTAHIVEMFAESGPEYRDHVASGVRWLMRNQEADGSWFGRWGANYIYGTGAVVPALILAGVDARHSAIRRAVRWLHSVQNADGGWGEDLRSYDDPSWAGKGDSTASQTAWALLALLAAGERGPRTQRGIQWLIDRQNAEGGWDEPQFTGTGFPGDFYIKYHMYRIVFPIMALGRWVNGGTTETAERADAADAAADRGAGDGGTAEVAQRAVGAGDTVVVAAADEAAWGAATDEPTAPLHVDAADPADSSKPAHRPANPTDPAHAATSADAGRPAESAKSAKSAKSAEASG
ncbi:squalene--hopene cyclase [Yinghuangia sp. YIM S10712]|uniref:squalene--hopene cyclase n=1 Tax=Yinghuangia sp. YIM S10712 TaxID=3436930 RepID=UPI003F537D33